METVNHEYYVSHEVAKLLKEAGFDWEVNHSYPDCESLDNSCPGYMEDLSFYHNLNDGKYGGISAPTLEVAQKWLREVGNKNGTVILTLNFNENTSKHWEVKGIHLNKDRTIMHWFYTCHVKPYGSGIIPVDCWDTYEEAQEAGIKKALETILEKG